MSATVMVNNMHIEDFITLGFAICTIDSRLSCHLYPTGNKYFFFDSDILFTIINNDFRFYL